MVIARIVIPAEHSDNDRFAKDCEEWFDYPITNLRSPKYESTWDVWEDKQYIAGIAGAPCTSILKKEVRREFQRPDDIHIFGYTADKRDKARSVAFIDNHPELTVRFPLIAYRLKKRHCHALVRAANIEIPVMYKLGFDNNNCIGCPKGGAGYWNKIRIHFPDVFERMCILSRRLGCKLIKLKGVRMYLDELPLNTGRQKDEVAISCSAFCYEAQDYLDNSP